MPDTITEVKTNVIEHYSKIFEDFGMSPTMIKVYMSLFFAKQPLGLQEISNETGYSISTVCGIADLLDKYADIKKFKKPGSKKIYYECTHDIKKAFRKKMVAQREMIQGLIAVLTDSEEKLGKVKDSDAKRIRDDISKLRKDYEKVEKMFGLLETMKIIG